MAHLRSVGPAVNLVVHLDMDYATLYERTEGFSNRGVVSNGKTCEELFLERTALYEQYRHVAVDCRGQSAHDTAFEVLRLMHDARTSAAVPINPPVLLGRAASFCGSARADNLELPFASQQSEPVLAA